MNQDFFLTKIFYFFFFSATNGDILAFVGRRYVLVMDEFDGLVRAARTNRLFRRAPRRPSAAFTIPSTGNTYFIRGKYLQACPPIITIILQESVLFFQFCKNKVFLYSNCYLLIFFYLTFTNRILIFLKFKNYSRYLLFKYM